MKVVIGILNYNNPSYTDRLVENIRSIVSVDYDMIVYDNGSDKDKISTYTTHKSANNSRMTGGFNAIISLLPTDYEYVWFFTNDCYFVTTDIDPLKNMIDKMKKYQDIGILHPSLDANVNVCYDVKNKNRKGIKIVNEYDFVCPLFSRKAMKSIGDIFNPNLICGWGIDYETSFLVRSSEMKVAINHDIVVMHETSSTYDKGLDCSYKNRHDFYDAAGKEMISVMEMKYGKFWNLKFKNSYNEKVGEWYE